MNLFDGINELVVTSFESKVTNRSDVPVSVIIKAVKNIDSVETVRTDKHDKLIIKNEPIDNNRLRFSKQKSIMYIKGIGTFTLLEGVNCSILKHMPMFYNFEGTFTIDFESAAGRTEMSEIFNQDPYFSLKINSFNTTFATFDNPDFKLD